MRHPRTRTGILKKRDKKVGPYTAFPIIASNRFLFAGSGNLCCGLDGARLIGMGAQIVLVRMGVRGMFLWQGRFFKGLVRRVRERVILRVVFGIFKMTIPVHTGTALYRDFLYRLLAWRWVSW